MGGKAENQVLQVPQGVTETQGRPFVLPPFTLTPESFLFPVPEVLPL